VKYGFNIDGGQSPGLPGLWQTMEPDYRPGGSERWVESHMSVYHPNLGAGIGGEIRLFSHTFQYQTGQTAAQTVSTWDFRANNGIAVSKLTGTPYFYIMPANVVWASQDHSAGIKIGGTVSGTPTALNPSTTTITPSTDAAPFRNLDFGNDWGVVSVRVPLITGGSNRFDTQNGATLQVAGKASFNSDLIFFGPGKRIRPFYAAVTNNDYTFMQSYTANAPTVFGMMPSGAARDAYFILTDRSDADNAAWLMLYAQGGGPATAMSISSMKTGTGSQLPLDLQIANVTKLRLNTDGRVTIGGATNDNTHQLQLTGAMAQSSYTQFTEIATPAAGPANTARIYAKDNGVGKTQLCAIFATGAEQCFATQP
jgi:hypothetical protein